MVWVIRNSSQSIRVKQFISITPQPVFTWLSRTDYRMLGSVVVFGGVFVGRRVAAMGFATGLASAQMQPAAPGFDTVHTFVGSGSFQVFQLG